MLLTINETLSTTGFPAEWTECSVTLEGLADPTSGRFAFHDDVPNGGPGSVNSNYVGVDSVSFVPSPAGAAVLAATGLLARRRRRRSDSDDATGVRWETHPAHGEKKSRPPAAISGP